MNGSASVSDVDPALIAAWLAARSIARGLPPPVADHHGWRVDTRSEAEWCRHVFATPAPEIAARARTIDRPRVFIKLCDEDDTLLRLLPSGWRLLDPSWVMVAGASAPDRPLPDGYSARSEATSDAVHVLISAPDGTPAASGHAAESAGVFVYDRIVTEPAHQRRGLGSVLMGVLRSHRKSDQSREILVATAAGRALYTALGWRVYAPYASAVSPGSMP